MKRLCFLVPLALYLLSLPAAAAAATEYVILTVNAQDAAIGGFDVSASGGGMTLAPDEGKTVIKGGQYTYYLPIPDPPQEDVDFTVTVASKPKEALSALRKGSSKTLTMTYNAIKSLTLAPTLQLQTDGQRSARLTVQKNPGLAATGPTGHPYITVRDYAAPVGWRSSDPAVCTVDGTGLVSAVSRGTATVTASVYGGKVEASCKVAVDLPVDDNGDPIDSSSLGQTVTWAGKSWWVVDDDGTKFGGKRYSVVLLANFNVIRGEFGDNNIYSASTVRQQCLDYYQSLSPERQAKLSPHAKVGDPVWLPSAYELYGSSRNSWALDCYEIPRQFGWLAGEGATATSYSPIGTLYANAKTYSWLRSPRQDWSNIACTVSISGYLNDQMGVYNSCPTRPAIILNP
ncbi:Ig-like domain-containing protein [Harryflintia acetispora]|uniref:Ig-like domain-containing protein n=1 Tax=Harryflintia acetispora TaxID=1849041 RepID=UPI001899B7CC|nr:Ig-like domain-containing protein [Harryflintia acetispora]